VRTLWSVSTGQQTGRVVDLASPCLLVTAGAYVAAGNPAKQLLCLDPGSGKIRWRYSGGATPIQYLRTSGNRVLLKDGPKTVRLNLADGRRVKPPLASGKAVGAPGHSGPTLPCRYRGTEVSCPLPRSRGGRWKATAEGRVTRLVHTAAWAVVAIEGPRVIRAYHRADGRIVWSLTVPPVPKVKYPKRVNFTFLIREGVLFVANYDGTVSAHQLPAEKP
jgi:outer membrane protein assembly factor BamB